MIDHYSLFDLCEAVLVVSYSLVVGIKILLQFLVEYLEIKDYFKYVVYILFHAFEVRGAKDDL